MVSTQTCLSAVPSHSCFSSSPGWVLRRCVLHRGVHSLTLLLLLTLFPTPLPAQRFLPCLTRAFLRSHHLGRGAQPCPVVGPLELAVSGTGQSQPLLTVTTLQPPASPWAPAPNATLQINKEKRQLLTQANSSGTLLQPYLPGRNSTEAITA